jgi:hypothetical protein
VSGCRRRCYLAGTVDMWLVTAGLLRGWGVGCCAGAPVYFPFRRVMRDGARVLAAQRSQTPIARASPRGDMTHPRWVPQRLQVSLLGYWGVWLGVSLCLVRMGHLFLSHEGSA